MDPVSGKTIAEKGKVSRVVNNLTKSFSDFGYFFYQWPLVEQLSEDEIYVAGTIKERL